MNPKTPNFDAMLAAVDGALGQMKDLPVSVKVVLSNRRGEVLVLKDARSDWNDLPGGHVHPGEEFADALAREVFEETGLRLDPASVARDGVPEQHVLGNRPASVVWFTATALDDGGDLSLSDEHSGAEWVRPWNLDEYNLGVLLPKAKTLATVGHQSRPVAASSVVGHPFFGNQWSKFARHAAQDPAGSPKGRIKHAVLVIGGQRYRGPSHFQALMAWSANNQKAQGMPKAVEGFETESGHFLDREQAAEYAAANKLITDHGEHAAQVNRRGELISEAITMSAIDGKLYTQDAVMAVAGVKASDEPVSHHETARRAAERIYKAAADDWLAQLNADLVAAIFGHKLMDYDGVWAAVYGAAAGGWVAAMEVAGRKAYAVTARTLGHDANVAHNPSEEALKGFAAGRKDLLSKFPQAVRDKVAASLKRGVAAGEDARSLARRAAESIDEISDGPTKRLAATEAQATYGLAQSEVLELAGYRLKVWRTMGDDRVRDSHYLCESQGAIPASVPFHNGLKYPGDFNGPPEEVINCRCNLEGVR